MQSSYIKSENIIHEKIVTDRFIFVVIIFLMTAYGYLYGLISVLPKDYIISMFIFAASLISAAFLCKNLNSRFEKISLLWLTLPFFILLNNAAFVHKEYLAAVREIFCVLILILLQFRCDWVDILGKCMLFFSGVHIFFSWLFFFFSDFYKEKVIPIFPLQSQITLRNNLKNGYLTGITPHYSTNGIYMALGVVVCTAFLMVYWKDKNKRIFYSIFDIIAVITLFMTGKRGPLLAAFLSVAIIYFILQREGLKKSIRIIIAAIPALVGILYILSQTVLPQINNIFERFTAADDSDISSGRFDIWAIALKMFKNNAFLGNGWLSFRFKYYSAMGYRGENYQYLDVHNVYIQLLCEVGLVGFIVIMAAIFATYILTARKIIAHNKGQKINNFGALLLSLGIQSFMIFYSFTGNPLYDCQVYIPYFLACAIGFALKPEKTKIKKSIYIK